jgi:Spy/CpxP family protein refolding chaperone
MKAKLFSLIFGYSVFLIMTLGNAGALTRELEQALTRIETIRIVRMTEALHLDKETAAKLAAVSSKYEQFRKVFSSLRQDMDRLRAILEEAQPNKNELKEIIERIKNDKRQIAHLRYQQIEEEMSLLTLEQQGGYLIFMVDFHKEMHGLIQEVRESQKKPQDE